MPSLTATEARARARTIQVERYSVDLDLTQGPQTFGSSTVVRFRCLDTSADTFVDVRPERLRAVRLNGVDVAPDAWHDGRLALRGLREHNELEVTAEMAYSHDGEGLHRSVDPADQRTYLYAMSFLDAAPRIFACFDQPDLKAPFSVTVSAPPDWTVIGNGAAWPVGDGRWRLDETRPLPPYLVTLVAGPYHSVRAEHDGIPLGLHVKQSLAEHLDKDAEEILTVTRQAFDEYHRLFGVRYPFGEYHQAFVPEFNAGAMENPGCVTFRDGLVFRSRVTDGERGDRARTIVHEMAHQWFGDLVTMQWWDDLWLNESFAEFMAVRVCQDATGFDDSWVDFAFSRKRWGMGDDQRPTTHPVAGNGVRDTESALNDFDGISYAKGAAVLKQLNAHLGDDVFLAGVRDHITTHAYGNATLSDLLDSWDRAGAADVHGWADQWLRRAGVDVLRLVSSEPGQDDDNPTVLHRAAPPDHPADRPHTLTVAVVDPGGGHRSATVRVDGEVTPVPLGYSSASSGEALVPDVHDDTWAKLRLDDRATAEMPRVLHRISDPVTRAVVWNSLSYAVDDAELDPRTMLDILESALPHEQHDIALTAVLGWTTRVLHGQHLPADAAGERVSRLAESVLSKAAPGSGGQIAAARAVAHCAIDGSWLRDWLDGRAPEGLHVDTEMRWTVLERLCVLGDADAADVEDERTRDGSAAGAVHAARCRASFPDQDAKETAWHTITADTSVSNYELYAACRGLFRPEQRDLTQPYVERYFAEMPTVAALRSGWVLRETARLAYPVYAVADDTVARAEEMLEGDLHPAVRRAVEDRTFDLRRALEVRRRFLDRA